MSILDLSGLIPAVVLPMTEGFEPDLVAYRRYLRWVVDQGPVAIAVNVDTGEGPHLSPAERRQVLDAALDEVGDAGVQHFVLHTLTPDPTRLDIWVREIVPYIQFTRGSAGAPTDALR